MPTEVLGINRFGISRMRTSALMLPGMSVEMSVDRCFFLGMVKKGCKYGKCQAKHQILQSTMEDSEHFSAFV